MGINSKYWNIKSGCAQYYLIFLDILLERYSYTILQKKKVMFREVWYCIHNELSWWDAELQFVLKPAPLQSPCFCIIQCCQQVEDGEIKGHLIFWPSIDLWEQKPYFKRISNTLVMDAIQLIYCLLGNCFVMRNCFSCCRGQHQQNLDMALKEIVVWKEQSTHSRLF